jgi:hypothetical protein
MAELAEKAFADAFPIDKLAVRWGCHERTIKNMEDAGELTSIKLPGNTRRHYKIADIAAFESRMSNPPAPPLTPTVDSPLPKVVQDAVERLNALIAKAEKTITPTMPEPMDARRREQAYAAFDAIVAADDRFYPLIQKNLTARLDTDVSFQADAVQSFIAAERAKINSVVSMLAKERHAELMDNLVGPTRKEIDAEVAATVKPAPIPRRGSVGDGLDGEGNLLEVEGIDANEIFPVTEAFTGFGFGKKGSK